MVDHIEVLTDGANSIYGADAIAGVINVITKKDFNGFDVDAGIGGTDKSDRLSYSSAATLGIGNDRGNVIINLAYNEQNPILQRDRDWSSAQPRDASGALIGPTSGRPPGLRLFSEGPNGGAFYYGGIHNNLVLEPGHRFDLTQTPYLVGELETKQANFTGHYDLTDGITAVMEGFFTDRSSHERLNPDPVDFLTTTIKYPNGFILPYCIGDVGVQDATGSFNNQGRGQSPTSHCGAHFFAGQGPNAGVNPNALRLNDKYGYDYLARTRRFEGGPRNYSDTINTYRLRIGLEGTLWNDYNWQIGYVYGASDARYETQGALNFTHLFQLAGLVPCGVDAAQGCHIGNVVGDNTLTKKEVAYMEFIDTRTSQVEQDYAYGDISGPLPYIPELPGGPVKFDIGFEYRNESTFDHPDSVIVNGDGDSNSAPTQGAYNVAAGYFEFKAPIFKDMPWVKELSVTGSVRYDYYSIFGSATTWKANLEYAPTEDVRFRGTRSTGFRAPSIKELFGGAFQNFEPIQADPCDTAIGPFAGTPSCVAALKAAGLSPAKIATYQSTQTQIATVNSGTPTLQPEESQSWDFGLVFTPRWVPGLSFSVDYWDVYIRNTIIDGISAQTLLNNCYDPAILSASSCAAVGNRQAGTGEVVQINAPNINFGFERTQGVDFATQYSFGASDVGIDRPGAFTISGNAQYLIHDINYQAPGTLPADFAGTWQIIGGSELGEPRWKALVNLGYGEDNWSASFTERYNGGVTLFQGTPGGPGNNAPGVFYSDISATYNYENASFTFGIDNLLDKDPPFLNDFATNSITNGGYDYIGRYLYMKVKVKFGGGEAPPPAAPYVAPAAVAPAPAVPHSYLVFFDFNKSDLTPQAVQIVDQAARNAETTKVTQLTVTGHTDTVGSDAYNMRLSRRRAESVASQLEKDGIPSSEIEIVAKGKRDLLVPTADGVREPQNRRVQIVYSGGPTS
jgi:iron complex outermembrane receptor protein